MSAEESTRVGYEPQDRHGERLARLENDTQWIRKGIAEIKQHLEGGGSRMDGQDKRMKLLEDEQLRVKTHLGWLKTIWFSLWAVILLALGVLAERIWR